MVARSYSNGGSDWAVFVNQFINGMPGAHANPLRKLSPEESEIARQAFRSIRREWTVESFVQGQSGLEYLESRGLNEFESRVLFEVRDLNLKYYSLKGYKTRLISTIANWKPQQIKVLKVELEQITGTKGPKDHGSELEWIAEKIVGQIHEGSQQEAFKTVTAVLKAALTSEQLQDVTDLWILTTLLSIDDFHPLNWMIADGKVTAIDLNRYPVYSQQVRPLEIEGQMLPFAMPSHVTPFARQYLLKHGSPRLKEYLKTNQAKSLQDLVMKSSLGRAQWDRIPRVMLKIKVYLEQSK